MWMVFTRKDVIFMGYVSFREGKTRSNAEKTWRIQLMKFDFANKPPVDVESNEANQTTQPPETTNKN